MELLIWPDEKLKQVSRTVNSFDNQLQCFVSELDEFRQSQPGGVGIAAPQVGRFERIVIIDVSAKKKTPAHGKLILINPEITDWEGSSAGREGCMSVPDYTGKVVRAKKITLSFNDIYGKLHVIHCRDYEARAVQHEIDHLDGLLFLDRLVSRQADLFQRK
jgi:peptide deformylase